MSCRKAEERAEKSLDHSYYTYVYFSNLPIPVCLDSALLLKTIRMKFSLILLTKQSKSSRQKVQKRWQKSMLMSQGYWDKHAFTFQYGSYKYDKNTAKYTHFQNTKEYFELLWKKVVLRKCQHWECKSRHTAHTMSVTDSTIYIGLIANCN